MLLYLAGAGLHRVLGILIRALPFDVLLHSESLNNNLLVKPQPRNEFLGLRTSSRLIDARQQHSRRVPIIANVTLDDVCLNVRGKRWEGLTRFMANGVPWQPIAEEVLDCAKSGKFRPWRTPPAAQCFLAQPPCARWSRTYSPAAYLAPLSVSSPLAESGTERRGPQNYAVCVLQAACLDVWLTTCLQEGFDSCLATGSSCELRRCRACWMWRRISLCDNFCDLL